MKTGNGARGWLLMNGRMLVAACGALVLAGGCAAGSGAADRGADSKAVGGGSSEASPKKEASNTRESRGVVGETAGPSWKAARHPLMTTRGSAPRTSLAVAAKGGFDLAMEVSREASVTYKKHTTSGASTAETQMLKDVLTFSATKTTELVQLSGGATLHRVDGTVTVSEPLSLHSLLSFLKRIERHSYLTASGVQFHTASKWWGVAREDTRITVSGWYAVGTPGLAETQVHLPKVSATRIAYELVKGIRKGELESVKVKSRSFEAKGTAESTAALQAYAAKIDSAHRCIGSVNVDSKPGASGRVSFRLSGKLKCRTR